MKHIDLIVGTRPEAIKMAPVYRALKAREGLSVRLVSTGQHRDLIRQTCAAFGIAPDVDLDVMTEGQTLSGLTASILTGLERSFRAQRPDLVLAHGDTTTCYVSALSAFYHSIPFFHVEAGLRTYRLDSPFPEEFNRQGVAKLATHHFAPTEVERENLRRDGIASDAITVTGGTVHDAVDDIRRIGNRRDTLACLPLNQRLAVLTLHRREAGLDGLPSMMRAIRSAASTNSDTLFIFPVHPNPVVRKAAQEIFAGCANVRLVQPLDYASFLSLMVRSSVVITDSGGIQEEAAYLGKRVLVLREKTERMDGMSQGLTRLLGTEPERIESGINDTLRATTELSLVTAPKTERRRASDIVAETVVERCA